MKKAEIKIGGFYQAKVSNRLTTVRVDHIDNGTDSIRYHVTNMATARLTIFRSAAKFRKEVEDPRLPKGISTTSVESISPTAEKRSEITPNQLNEARKEAEASSTPFSSSLAGKVLSIPKVSEEGPHIEVKALAGCGKTSAIVGGVIAMKGGVPPITPSQQQGSVWEEMRIGKSDTIRLSSFSNAITDELKERVSTYGLDKKGVEARGVHSLGLQAVTKALGRMNLNQANWVVPDFIAEVLGKDIRDLRKDGKATLVSATEDLVSLCKQTLTEPTPENLLQLASHYDVELNDSRLEIFDLVPRILEKCRSPKGRINFDDMIWLPNVLNLPITRVDMQIIDESQDLNRAQQEIVYKGGHRIVFVGDENQAIFGFAGADSESMVRMATTLGESSRGMKTLLLTITRRCSKAVVTEAQALVPSFEAHPSNLEGLIRTAKYPFRKRGDQQEVKWEDSYCTLVKPGDFVLCRVNAPLVSNCFKFLRQGIKANILGRSVGAGLTALLKKSKVATIPDLVAWLEGWLEKEQGAENAKKCPSEHRLIALQDKHDCLLCFTEGCQTISDVERKIDNIFTDDKKSPGVRLASIHKSKGLEAENVFLLEPEGATVPHPMAKSAWQRKQEKNLRYVALTRAINTLTYVS